MRRYRRRKQLRLQAQRLQPTIDASTHTYQNSNMAHQRDRLVFDFYHTGTESQRDDEIAAASKLVNFK